MRRAADADAGGKAEEGDEEDEGCQLLMLLLLRGCNAAVARAAPLLRCVETAIARAADAGMPRGSSG